MAVPSLGGLGRIAGLDLRELLVGIEQRLGLLRDGLLRRVEGGALREPDMPEMSQQVNRTAVIRS
jgi:hypothetical protein